MPDQEPPPAATQPHLAQPHLTQPVRRLLRCARCREYYVEGEAHACAREPRPFAGEAGVRPRDAGPLGGDAVTRAAVRCAWCGAGRELALVGVVEQNTGPGRAQYACARCRERYRILRVAEHPPGSCGSVRYRPGPGT